MSVPTLPVRSPKWVQFGCYLLVAAAAIPYLVALDRYPAPFVDESFFNYPAVSYRDGTGLAYKVRADAPHGDRIWAYHAPFFPRLQVLVLGLCGENQFGFRITEFLAANLAIVVLCCTLFRCGFCWAPLALAVCWVGDRSLEQVLCGRMEGLYLLCLASGFWALVGPATTARQILAGASLAAAVGFHPVTLFFPLAGGVWVLRRDGVVGLARYCMGVSIPFTLFMACWLLDLNASLEQFLWHASLFDHSHLIANWVIAVSLLKWSAAWFVSLIAATIALGLGLVSSSRTETGRDIWGASRLAALFAACGLLGMVVIVRGAIFPYYIVILSVWPVVAIGIRIESNGWRHSLLYLVLALLLAVSWVPSLFWNAMRVREIVVYYNRLNLSPFHAALREHVPADAQLSGTPKLLGVVRASGIHYTPFPWYGGELSLTGGEWLLLTEDHYQGVKDSEGISTRPVMAKLELFGNAAPMKVPVILLGPVSRLQPISAN